MKDVWEQNSEENNLNCAMEINKVGNIYMLGYFIIANFARYYYGRQIKNMICVEHVSIS
jgi:hypothetical protein